MRDVAATVSQAHALVSDCVFCEVCVPEHHAYELRCMQNMVNGLVEKTRGHISPVSIESIVPEAPLRTVSAHEGGAYTLAFDR